MRYTRVCEDDAEGLVLGTVEERPASSRCKAWIIKMYREVWY